MAGLQCNAMDEMNETTQKPKGAPNDDFFLHMLCSVVFWTWAFFKLAGPELLDAIYRFLNVRIFLIPAYLKHNQLCWIWKFRFLYLWKKHYLGR